MTTYYKAVRPDGMDFFSSKVRWLPPVGEPLQYDLLMAPWRSVIGDQA